MNAESCPVWAQFQEGDRIFPFAQKATKMGPRCRLSREESFDWSKASLSFPLTSHVVEGSRVTLLGLEHQPPSPPLVLVPDSMPGGAAEPPLALPQGTELSGNWLSE